MFSGFGLTPFASGFQSYFVKSEEGDTGDQDETEVESKEERASQPVITSLCALHSLDGSEMFTEFYREEKREERDKGGQEDKGRNQKERDRSSQ